MTAWLPSDAATGLALWIDPSDAATVTTSAGRITQITDKSGNGNTFTARNATGPSTTTQNSLTAISGSTLANVATASQKLWLNTTALNSVTNGDSTYASVAGMTGTPGSVTGAFGVMDPTTNNPASRGYAFVYDDTVAKVARWRHGGTTNSGSNTKVMVAVATHSGTAINGYANGTLDLTASNGSNFTSVTGAHFIGGWYPNTTGWCFPGWIGDCIIYSGVLSTGDREKLEGYLAHKWGLQGSLPGAHPYKAAPPTTGSDGNASGALSGVTVTGLAATASGNAAVTSAMGATVTVGALGGAGGVSVNATGTLGSTVTLSALGGATTAGGSAAGNLSGVTAAALSGGALGNGNAGGSLSSVTATPMMGSAAGGMVISGNASGAFGAGVTVFALGGSASGGEIPIVQPDPYPYKIKARDRGKSARSDIEEAIRETEQPKAPVKPKPIPGVSAPAPARTNFSGEIAALQQQLELIREDQARGAILAEIARIQEAQRIALLWEDEAAALLLLAA